MKRWKPKRKFILLILILFSQLNIISKLDSKEIIVNKNIYPKELNKDEKEILEILCSKFKNNIDISYAITSIALGGKHNWPEDTQTVAFKVCIKGNYISKNKNKMNKYITIGSLKSICIANYFNYIKRKHGEKMISIVLSDFHRETKGERKYKEDQIIFVIKSTINNLPSCSELFIKKKPKNKILNNLN